jgi:hypothetical protein
LAGSGWKLAAFLFWTCECSFVYTKIFARRLCKDEERQRYSSDKDDQLLRARRWWIASGYKKSKAWLEKWRGHGNPEHSWTLSKLWILTF